MKKVVIVGGGFAGLRLARRLNNREGWQITLIDKNNYHQFQPLFYQVATAGLDASDISFPLRKVFHKSRNVRIRICELISIRAQDNTIETSIGSMSYDYLVIASGADTNFFGNEKVSANAFPMKSTVEALELRHRLLQNFEDVLSIKDSQEQQSFMNVIVVGGGPTGVEVAGALADWRRFVLPKDYPEIDFSKMNIYLLEGMDRTLAAMSEKSSQKSQKYLEKLGVKVMTNTLLQEYDGEKAILKNGEVIQSRTVIWAAGIKGNVPNGIEKSLIGRGNRIKVDRFNRIEGLSNVFAIGDVASMAEQRFPNSHPQVAPVAIQQADLLAKNLQALERGEELSKEFSYKDKGSMATVGRHLAVVDSAKPKLHFGGFFAWVVWMVLHLFLILGVKNRFFVFMNWAYNYVTYDQNLRLIFKEFERHDQHTK